MMYISRSFIIAAALKLLTLIKCIASAPQYFVDSCIYPIAFKGNLMYLTPGTGQDLYDIRGSYPASFYPVNYLGSDPWLGSDYSLDTSLVPPVREGSEFKSVGTEIESEGNGLHRGRSDIDPVEDNEGLGYFYPKPKITFDLPSFTPLGDAEAVPQDVTVAAATTTEETTDKVTTVSVTETSSVKV